MLCLPTYLRMTNLDSSLQVGRPNIPGSSSQNAYLKARSSPEISPMHPSQRILEKSGFRPESLRGESERSFLAGSNECSMDMRLPRLQWGANANSIESGADVVYVSAVERAEGFE